MLLERLKNCNKATIEVARDIENVFLGDLASQFRGWTNLFDYLDEMFSATTEDIWSGWPAAIQEIRIELAGEKPLASTRFRGNSMGGQFRSFCIVSCLTEKPGTPIKKQYRSLCLLLIHRIITTKRSSKLKKISTLMRIGANPRNSGYEIIEALPVYEGDLEAYKKELVAHLNGIEVDGLDSRQKDLVVSIKGIGKYQYNKKKTSVGRFEPQNIWQPVGIESSVSSKGGEEGLLCEERIISGGVSAEDGQSIFLFKEDSKDNDDPESLDGLQAKSKRSRYWVRRHYNLTKYDRECLTEIERRRLSEYIHGELENEEGTELLIAVVIAIAYITPMTISEVAELVYDGGEMRQILSCGGLRRKVIVPEDAFHPNRIHLSGCCSVVDKIKLIMPKMLLAAIKKLFGMQISSRICEQDKLKVMIEDRLKQIREFGRIRITCRRIDAALKNEIVINERNPLITFLLAGKDSYAVPMMAYYTSIPVSHLQDVYQESVHKLMMRPGKDVNYDSAKTKAVATANEVNRHVTKQINGLRCLFKNSRAKIWEKHNAFVNYCVSMLMFATWHRPVNDPFESINRVDTNNGLVAIDDKNIDEKHRNRIVALPEIAAKQLNVYLSYLSSLRIDLIRMGKEFYLLADAIGRVLLTDKKQKAFDTPLFFYLDDDLNSTFTVDNESIRECFNRYSWFPANYGRHLGASTFAEERGWCRQIQLQLGHFEGVDHPFGTVSEISVKDEMRKIGGKVESLMRSQGWQLVCAKVKRGKLATLRKSRVEKGCLHENELIGSRLRGKSREKKYEKRSGIVRKAFEQVQLKTGNKKWDEVDRNLVEKKIIELASSDDINKCLRILYRWIKTKDVNINSPRIMALKNEASPFNDKILKKYGDVQELRNKFLQRLEDKGKKGDEISVVERVAEIIVSAALFGYVGNSSRLQNLVISLNRGCYIYKNEVFVDLILVDNYKGDEAKNVYRWFVDKLSAVLILGLYRRLDVSSVIYSRGDVGREIKKIIKACGKGVGKKNVWVALARWSKVAMTIEVPGYVRSVATGEIVSASLPLNSYVRIKSGRRLVYKEKAVKDIGLDDINVVIQIDGDKCNTEYNAKCFSKDMRLAFRGAENIEAKGGRKRDATIRRELNKRVKAILNNNTNYSQMERLLAGWVLHLSENGTRFRKSGVKFNTVRKYYGLIHKPLTELVGTKNFLQMVEVEYEEIYMKASDYAKNNNAPYLIGRLMEFHLFVVNGYSVDEPEWAEIYAYAGVEIYGVVPDANILKEEEYLKVYKYISNDKCLATVIRHQYCLLLMMGYRFGLRFSEAYKIQHRDIQHSDSFDEFNVIIRNNIYGDEKTYAGCRVVRDIIKLTQNEKFSFKYLVNFFNDSFKSDNQQSLLSADLSGRQLIDRSGASLYINKLLKVITGDCSVRYHHLRHSYANQLYKWKDITLRELAVQIGHASEETTLGSYIHRVDKTIHLLSHKVSPTFSLRLLVYATRMKYDAVRKRVARANKNSTSVINTFDFKRYLPCPSVEFEKDYIVPEIGEVLNDVTTSHIYRLLNDGRHLNGLDDDRLNNIAEKTSLALAQVREIFEKAKLVERRSGYVLFSVQALMTSTYKDGYSLRDVDKFCLEEKTRLRRLLSTFDRTVDKMEGEDIAEIKKGLNVWAKSYDPVSNNLLLTDLAHIDIFRSTMIKAGVNGLTYEITVPVGQTECLQEVQDKFSQCYVIKVKNFRHAFEKTKIGKRNRVSLSVATYNSEFKTKRTMFCFLFVLAVNFALESERRGDILINGI